MRTGALLLAILMGATSVTAATAAPKKHKVVAAKPAEPEDLNANGKKLVRDGLPLIMPSFVMFWMLHNKEEEAKAAQAQKVSMKKAHRVHQGAKTKKV